MMKNKPNRVKDKPNPAPRLAIVIPTKDRPESLRRTLKSLVEQSRRPEQVIIVASGGRESEVVAAEFTEVPVLYIYKPLASISSARNAGMEAACRDVTLIGFVDDDIVFDPGAIESMLSFWETAPEDVGGAGFNFRNMLAPETARKWSLKPVKTLYGLFLGKAKEKGKVLRSGFATPIYPVSETIRVDWLETIAVVFRRQVLDRYRFDEFFAGYSYLEFLDFTYSIGKKFKLYVVGDAWVTHHSSPIKNSYLLGRKQMLNRIYFVRKHPELSLPRCLGALVLHMGFNVAVGVMLRDSGYFKRAWGNIAGFAQAAMGRLDPVTGGVK
ncbi:MAG TPA: glycosyltransferase [Terriglobia bacterium]|nr:glycosyltransferase [Terriglobia bacterium]